MMKGWQQRPLEDLVEPDAPITYGVVKPGAEGDVCFVRGGDISGGRVLESQLRTITKAVSSQYKRTLLRGGELLMCLVGQPGQVAVASDSLAGANIARQVGLIRLQATTDSRFVSYFFQSPDGQRRLGTYTGGSVQQVINLSDLRTVLVPVPQLSEQRRIVSVLDEAFAALAIALVNTEKNLQNTRALFKSYLQSVFTLPEKGWVKTTVDKLSINIDSKRIPITKSDRKAGQYPYYGASGIVDYVASYIFEGDALLVSEDGANLLMRSTPIAFSVSDKYWVNNHAHILRFDSKVTQSFVEFYLNSIRLDEYIRGAAQPKLTQKALNSIPIHIPKDIGEQKRIVAKLDTLAAETQRLTQIYKQKLSALAELKKSLLHQAFNGEL